MRRFALATLCALLGTAAMADPIEGLWQTQADDGAYAHVKISACGANYCGVIARTFKDGGEYKSDNLGKRLVIDMAPKGGGKYEGQVWRPSNNKIYLGKINLTGDKMKLAGCIAGGLLCSKQNWQRLK